MKLEGFASALGVEVYIRVGRVNNDDPKIKQLNDLDHTLYEVKRIFEDGMEIKLDRAISIFFEVLGRFYQKVSKFDRILPDQRRWKQNSWEVI